MDATVQSLQSSYLSMLTAAATALEAKQAADGERNSTTDEALQAFCQSYQCFYAVCDKAQEFIESVRQRLGLECLVDEATGPAATKMGADGAAAAAPAPTKGPAVAPLSAVRLEQLSKAVRWLVIELQHGAAAAAAAGTGGVLAHPSEDMS